jgi:hypothetical protein
MGSLKVLVEVLCSEYHGVGPHTSTGESKYVEGDARARAH